MLCPASALAVHFGTWVPSAKLTSVAMSVALVCTTPVWTALIARSAGIHVPGRPGSASGSPCSASPSPPAPISACPDGRVLGDALALAGGIAAAGYTMLGEHARGSIATSTTTYTDLLLDLRGRARGRCLLGGQDLTGYPAQTWLALAAMTVGPQLLGHT